MKLSIIIPSLNEEKYIRKTLDNLASLKGNFEVLVVDGGSTDHTLQLVQQFPWVKILSSEKGRAVQMNLGAKSASGEVLLFLHADTLLPPNAYQVVLEHLKDNNMIGGSFFLQFDNDHPVLNFYSWCSKINLEFFTYGDHGIFVRRNVFKKISGYKNVPFMEDVEIQRRLRREGKFRKVKCGVKTSARRFQKIGMIRQMILNVFLVFLFKVGVPPAKLKVYYKDHA